MSRERNRSVARGRHTTIAGRRWPDRNPGSDPAWPRPAGKNRAHGRWPVGAPSAPGWSGPVLRAPAKGRQATCVRARDRVSMPGRPRRRYPRVETSPIREQRTIRGAPRRTPVRRVRAGRLVSQRAGASAAARLRGRSRGVAGAARMRPAPDHRAGLPVFPGRPSMFLPWRSSIYQNCRVTRRHTPRLVVSATRAWLTGL